jgi:hypothetical protein
MDIATSPSVDIPLVLLHLNVGLNIDIFNRVVLTPGDKWKEKELRVCTGGWFRYRVG